MADTFAEGRLTNPTPPVLMLLWSPDILLEPTYQSKYLRATRDYGATAALLVVSDDTTHRLLLAPRIHTVSPCRAAHCTSATGC